ncbi:MAG: MOFRL family protein, partial [Candidatus Thorarchaeota archaeon]
LLSIPENGLSNDEYLMTWKLLLYSGLEINEINKFRSIIDGVKGGKLLKGIKASVIGFYVSDVVGDNLSSIGSGPTVPFTVEGFETFPEFQNFPNELKKKLTLLSTKTREITCSYENYLLISQLEFSKKFRELILEEKLSCKLFVKPFFNDFVQTVNRIFADLSLIMKTDYIKRTVYLWSGESSVKISSSANIGKGGRNQHLLLYLTKKWIEAHMPEAYIFTFGTDGIDGNTDFAGGWIMTKDCNEKGDLDRISSCLKDYDSSNFLLPDRIIKTGPTSINFADIVGIYVP